MGTSDSPDPRGLRLLVVEDNPLVAMELIDELSDRGHRIAGSAATVPQALRLIEELKDGVDAAILDANLGGQAAAPIAESLRRARIPFVIASGYGAAELRRLGYAEPALCKPFATRELERALRAVADPGRRAGLTGEPPGG
jgi:DNA-binding response OmpR family regulator